MINQYIEKISFILILIIPISIVVGPSISLLNVIIINIFIFFIFFEQKKDLSFLNHYSLKSLLLLYFYLIFNNFISLDNEINLARNYGFVRLILFFIFINYFFFHFNSRKILNYWTILFSIFVFDVYYEYFVGSNIFGWGALEIDGVEQPHALRIISFFKDEPIAGAFMSGFIFLLFGNLLNEYPQKKILGVIFLLTVFLAILLTGERSNTIKVLLGIILFFLLSNNFSLKSKLITPIVIFLFSIIIISQSNYIKTRYIDQTLEKINSRSNITNFLSNNLYIKLYNSGFEVFKSYPFFGVGNKNYRVETCNDNKNKIRNSKYICMTHPHQVYIEFLSEHGIFGTMFVILIFFYLMFKIYKENFLSENPIQLGAFVFILINFTPLIPSGSFFSDFNLFIFFINLSIMFGSHKKTNIFNK